MSRAPLPDARQRSRAWHQAECWLYTADLPHWRQLAAEADDPCLDLGCGTGRVSFDLANHRHEVWALDQDPDLLSAIDHPQIHTVQADLLDFKLDRQFDLILAPMQLIQLLSGPHERVSSFERIRRHLAPGGRFALATLDFVPRPDQIGPDLFEGRHLEPDRDNLPGGYVALSRPISARVDPDHGLELQRLRWLESEAQPGIRLAEETSTVNLALIDNAGLAAELIRAGMRIERNLHIPATSAHVASNLTVAISLRDNL